MRRGGSRSASVWRSARSAVWRCSLRSLVSSRVGCSRPRPRTASWRKRWLASRDLASRRGRRRGACRGVRGGPASRRCRASASIWSMSLPPRRRKRDEADHLVVELGEPGVGGDLGVEHQQAGLLAGALLPELAEADDLVRLLGLVRGRRWRSRGWRVSPSWAKNVSTASGALASGAGRSALRGSDPRRSS